MIAEYPKIHNLGHKDLTGLFIGNVSIQEKIDGSQISFGKIDGKLCIRSKGVDITNQPDHGLFKSAIQVIKELDLCPEWIYRGEFLRKPKHNVLAYDRIPKKNIILFDIEELGRTMVHDYVSEEAFRLGLESVPELYYGSIYENTLTGYLNTISILGGQKVEGIVIKNSQGLMGKLVSDQFKETHRKEWKVGEGFIQGLVKQYKTEARWNKAIQHLEDSLVNTSEDIGPLIKEVHRDIDSECGEEIKELLYTHYRKEIVHGITTGLPEWYKEKCLKSIIQKI